MPDKKVLPGKQDGGAGASTACIEYASQSECQPRGVTASGAPSSRGHREAVLDMSKAVGSTCRNPTYPRRGPGHGALHEPALLDPAPGVRC